MKTYNHAFTIAFEVAGSSKEDGSDVTAEAFKKALKNRMNDLDSAGELEWQEAIGAPYDTYEE